MTPPPPVTVHLWASARAAAGVGVVEVALDPECSEGTSEPDLAWLRRRLVELLPDRPALERTLGVCSVLIGDVPSHDPMARLRPGDVVEFLPPFAGG